tara:strand:- start:388 stop:2421 length:2034 start_codon:yes stop_codon:yes gene_type:complete
VGKPAQKQVIADPERPISALKGVGPSLTQKFEGISIVTIEDLIKHLPNRYEDRSHIVPMKDIKIGEQALVQGEIVDSTVSFGRKRSLLITITDNTEYLKLRFFHFSKGQQSAFQVGTIIRAFGTARMGNKGIEFIHPEYRVYVEEPPAPENALTPVYPLTSGIGQGRLRALTDQLLKMDWTQSNHLPYETLFYLHRPPPEAKDSDIEAARSQIALEELTAYYIAMRIQQKGRLDQTTVPLPSSLKLGRVLLNELGFKLTKSQQEVLTQVLKDLAKPTPMLRLLQGDVGSGKTIIAAFAAIRAAEQGRQTAVMAPTEILAEQHYLNFSAWLEPLGIPVVLVTGSQKASERKKTEQSLADGTTLVAVGTHAIFQKSVVFKKLSLTIIDEQHRFGVHQRMALVNKGFIPHQLVMTATPIPRTLTMALYGNMDVSVINELPPGRQPIDTRAISNERRGEVVKAIRNTIAKGQQAYWVCPLIEESAQLNLASAGATAKKLASSLGLKTVGLLHGRMSNKEKSTIMADFKSKKIPLLVATTVIEVGVDTPNATLVVIENAERMGLAQLHQLRGRVGRGDEPSHCILLYSTPLSEKSRGRLQIMRDSTDGFYIAEKDLEMRGPGEVAGTRQTGEQQFRVANLGTHAHLIPAAIDKGEKLATTDQKGADALLKAWGPKQIHHLGV